MGSGKDLGGNAVQITLALGGNLATTVAVLLQQVQLLQSLESLAVDGTSSILVVGGASAAALLAAVDQVQGTNTNSRAQVNVAGDGGDAHIEPVRVVWGHLLGAAGLDQVNPGGDGNLAGALQVGGIGIDEFVSVNVADTDTSHSCRMVSLRRKICDDQGGYVVLTLNHYTPVTERITLFICICASGRLLAFAGD